MATRIRELAQGKEKRGTSSSQLHANSHRSSLSRPRDPDAKHDPPASEKRVPNYLKPTLCSSRHVSKQLVKKQVLGNSKRTNLTRTRFLDKVQSSPSCTQNTLNSSNPTRTQNQVLPKDGRPLYASTKKKSSTDSKKQETEVGASTKNEQAADPPERVVTLDIPEVPQLETLQEKEEFSVLEAEEETIQDNETRELEDMEPVRQIQLESLEDKAEPDQQDLDENNAGEENETKTSVSVTNSPEEGVNALDNKEEAIIGGETLDPEGTKDEEVAEEVKQEAEHAAPQQQSAQEEKNSAVSNDVIEETASKLREQRRNKVKALAGAFETVISLQEPK